MTTIAALRSALPKLGPRDAAFAQSLLSAPRLSEKQAYWVGELVKRATQPVAAVTIPNMAGIIGLLRKGTERLKHPAIVLSDGDTLVRLSIAGPTAKLPGSINVTSPGAFDARRWFGRIALTGEYQAGRDNQPSITALLTRFAADPASIAAEHGRRTGSCCFCNRRLDDKRSVGVGYGPICADNYGLPWGNA